jgi:tetratricopeptide (TPR) repeat protein
MKSQPSRFSPAERLRKPVRLIDDKTIRQKRHLSDDGLLVPGVCIFLATIVWMAFGQTIRHGFVNYDDDMYVYQNPAVAAGLTRRGILWALTFGEIGHWHPVTWFSHMLDCRVWGLQAGGHHLTNVVLHATAAILLFLALKQITAALWRSAVVAALFAIHPQRVESVAWIAERKDVLSGVFFMATILAYARYVAKPPSRARYGAVVVLFALGLMSKGMLITLPFVLLLLDYWPLGRLKPEVVRSIRRPESRAIVWRLVVEKIPLFALSAASCIATNLSPEKIPPALRTLFSLRIENAIVSYVIYVKQMFYPTGLMLPYFNPPGGFSWWQVIIAMALLIAVSIGALAFWKTRPYLMVGWLWYLVMMAPVIGLVQISYYVRADRYTYLPHIGLYLLATWGAAEWFRERRYGREILAGAALFLIVVLTMRSQAQASSWRDSETLWRYVVRTAPDNYVACAHLGLALDEKGQVEAAIPEYERALQIQPAYAEAHNNLGNALRRVGRRQEAIAHYKKALELVPDQLQFHNNLGTALGENGQLSEAMAHFRKSLEIHPNFAAYANLGYTLLMSGKEDEALPELLKALELNPNAADIHKNIAILFHKQGRAEDAIAHFRKALEITPDDVETRRNLERALAERRP